MIELIAIICLLIVCGTASVCIILGTLDTLGLLDKFKR